MSQRYAELNDWQVRTQEAVSYFTLDELVTLKTLVFGDIPFSRGHPPSREKSRGLQATPPLSRERAVSEGTMGMSTGGGSSRPQTPADKNDKSDRTDNNQNNSSLSAQQGHTNKDNPQLTSTERGLNEKGLNEKDAVAAAVAITPMFPTTRGSALAVHEAPNEAFFLYKHLTTKALQNYQPRLHSV